MSIPEPATSDIALDTPEEKHSHIWFGVICALVAAVGYTCANIALRQSARPGNLEWSMWITAHKAIPATLLTWTLVLNNYCKGRPAFPPKGLLLPLIATGFLMQFGGNMMFQFALGLIGLAMTVPMTFAMILTAGAVSSRLFLGEPITLRTLLAMSILMFAVTILSMGAGEASESILKTASRADILLGILSAMISGTCYGLSGTVIRRNVKNLPVSATLFLISTTGTVAMTTAALLSNPLEDLLATTPKEVVIMQLAGVFNAMAFYAIGTAYRHLAVTQTNMINTTQIAMASVAGVVVFAEPMTIWLILGVVFTMIGLYLMERR